MSDILIVDDEPEIINLLRILLEENSYNCLSASNVADAKALMARHPFILLISDFSMPGESGLDLVHYVKKNHPRMAQIIMTAKNDPESAQAFLDAGIHGFILKPWSVYQMLITVKSALTHREFEIQAEMLRYQLEEKVEKRTAELNETISALEREKEKNIAASRELKNQLLLVETMQDAMPSPIYFKDKNGKYLGCNEAFQSYLGLSRDRIMGKTIFDLAPPDRAEIHAGMDRDLLEKGGRQAYEISVRHADGTMRDMHIIKATYRDSTGTIDGIVGVMLDITERKKHESALRLSEEKLRRILDNITIGVALIGPDMQVLETNKKIEQWFPSLDKRNGELCFQQFFNPPKDDFCEECPVHNTLADGKVHEKVLIREDPDGSRTFRVASSAVLDEKGRIMAAIALVDDITDKTNMERELMQSQKMASIGQLAAGVAHEINNPTGFVSSNLTTLGGYVDDLDKLVAAYRELNRQICAFNNSDPGTALLERAVHIQTMEDEIDIQYIQDDIKVLINDCRVGTDRIKKIVEDLKHFAHPGQNKVQDTDLNKELETTLNVVNNELKYKATVITEFDDLPIIRANPQQLNQVFINILVNAAQAIDNDGEIRIRTSQQNGSVEVRISDTGCGIPEEHMEKIFDPFFTTKEIGKGTGLGMNIVYNIIEKHHGSIDVQSQVGQGTTFTIKIPVDATA